MITVSIGTKAAILGKIIATNYFFISFKKALPHVQPSAKREGFATVPDVSWDDIGALEDIREELTMAIMVGGFVHLNLFDVLPRG